MIANRSTETLEVESREYAPGSAEAEATPVGLSWPPGVVSLGHVALPFPPDDPVYGYLPGSGANGVPSLGSWALRGEEGAIVLPLGALSRMRSNPFWEVVVREVGRCF